MEVKIIHRLPGRIRLQYRKNTLTSKQIVLVKVLLSTQEGISSISINPVTCSILVYYKNITEKHVIALFHSLNDKYLNDEDMLSSINEQTTEHSISSTIFFISATPAVTALIL